MRALGVSVELRHRHGSENARTDDHLVWLSSVQGPSSLHVWVWVQEAFQGGRGTEGGDRISLRVLNFHTVPKCEGRCLESADGPLRSPLVTPEKSLPLYRERQASHPWAGCGIVLLVPSKGQIRNAQLQKEGYPRHSKEGSVRSRRGQPGRLCPSTAPLSSQRWEVATGMHIKG